MFDRIGPYLSVKALWDNLLMLFPVTVAKRSSSKVNELHVWQVEQGLPRMGGGLKQSSLVEEY